MLIRLYNNGESGFVIHGITGNFKGKVSAYFNARGGLEDAEQFVSPGDAMARSVKRGGPIWKHAESYAKQGMEAAAKGVAK